MRESGVTQATYPAIGDVRYFYDATGLKTKVTEALNHSTEYFFDYTKHQLTRTLDALGKELKYYWYDLELWTIKISSVSDYRE